MANSKEMTGGAVFPLLFSFTMPLLLGNLLQQTYSLIDAAIVGKFLGINSGSRRSQYLGDFLDSGIL